MNVLIVERNSGQVVAQYPVELQGLNYTPSEQEYFNLAWQNAIEDGIVDHNKLEEYELRKSE